MDLAKDASALTSLFPRRNVETSDRLGVVEGRVRGVLKLMDPKWRDWLAERGVW